MPAEEVGTLAQKVLSLLNERSRLIASGVKETALTILKLDKQIAIAKLAQQAATGSQRGMGPGAGGGMFAFGLPSFTQEQGMGISGGRPGGELMNEGPLGQLLAQLLPSIFGAGGGLPNAQQVPGGGQMQMPGVSGGPLQFLPPVGPGGPGTGPQLRKQFVQPGPNAEPTGGMAARMGRDFLERPQFAQPMSERNIKPKPAAISKPKPKPKSGPGRRS